MIADMQWLLERCLAKDPDDRWQTARDLKAELDRIADVPATAAAAASSPGKRNYWPAATLVSLLLAAVFAMLWQHRTMTVENAVQFEIDPPPNNRFISPYAATAISPDGRWIVYAAGVGGGVSHQLWIRPADSSSSRPLAGTEGGNS